MGIRRVDLSGKRFGRYSVGERVDRGDGHHYWRCRCDCGSERVVQGSHLTRGNAQSCGCLRGVPRQRHGLTDTPEYRAWYGMRQRCFDPNMHIYRHYGGRGITVCERWASFPAFLLDMGPKPSAGHSLGRINNDGPYEPGNCRWETLLQQARNNRHNRIVSFKGESMSLAEAADRSGICYGTLKARLRVGCEMHDLFRPPIRGKPRPGYKRKASARAAQSKTRI